MSYKHIVLPFSPLSYIVVIVQWLSCVQCFVAPWTAAHEPSLSLPISWSLLKFMFIESVMPSNHHILSTPSPLTLAVQETQDSSPTSQFKSINSSASILLYPYMTTGKTIALTIRTFVSKVMSLLLNVLSRFVIGSGYLFHNNSTYTISVFQFISLSWCPCSPVHSLGLCPYFCFADRFTCTGLLDSTCIG